MASGIGSLVVNITSRTQGLSKGLKSAGSMVGGFASRIGGLVTKFGPLAAAITGVAGAAGMGMLVNRSFETIDALAKAADAAGITTEAMAGLQRAGELSGVSAEQVTKGVQRMQRSLSAAFQNVQAERGSAGVVKNFKQLGLSVEELRKLSPDDQFIAIGDALNNIPDAADRTRIAMETFGRDGVGMLNMFKGGAESVRAEIERTKELGLAPSREDAALIEQANDAWADMKNSFIGVANTLAIALAPAFTGIATTVTNVGIAIRQAFEAIRPHISAAIAMAGAFWNMLMSGIKAVFGPLVSVAGEAFTGVGDFILDTLIIAEFTFNNIGEIATLAWEKVKLGAVTLFNDIAFFFTGTLPALFNWFTENWRATFFTAFDLATTIFINIGKNIRNLFTAVWDFIAGRGWNFAFTPITEGFHNAMSELELPEREMSALEQDLHGRIGEMSEGLSLELSQFMEQRKAELSAGIAAELDGTEFDIPEMELGESAKQALEGPRGAERGSAEALSSIFSTMRNTGDPAAETAKLTKDQLAEQKRQTRILERLERNKGNELAVQPL